MVSRITMLETRRGTEDGFSMQQYKAGEVYEVADNLAAHFCSSGYARWTPDIATLDSMSWDMARTRPDSYIGKYLREQGVL